MSARNNGIGIPDRPPITQRPPAKPKTFGVVRTPLKKKKQSGPPKMSADAKVQDAMLGKGRCYVADGMESNCIDGRSQRSHIVKQTTIADAFSDGAWSDGTRIVSTDHEFNLDIEAEWTLIPLQSILDDTRNIVPTCPAHNLDGLPMVEALGMVGTPDGFDDFLKEYGFSFNGRYWVREVGA